MGRRIDGIAMAGTLYNPVVEAARKEPTVRILAIVALTLFAALGPARAAESPQQVVVALQDTLLDVMKHAGSLGFKGRYERLEPILTESFNFPLMARVSVGRHWKRLDEAARKELVDAYSRMSVATFAARFNGYSGQRFEVLSEDETARGGKVVKTQLVSPNEDPIALNYVMRRAREHWRIIDVSLDAKYSELARQRSEFTAVMDREGLDGLVRTIRDKVEQLSNGDAS